MYPKFLNWLTLEETINTLEKKDVNILKLEILEDEEILNQWANHFRKNYISDSEIDILREGTGYSREDYLNNIKFPDSKESFGPRVRSGDFSELLVADYVEYILNYYVPRTRYERKINRNSSPMGSDLVAFKMAKKNSFDDELLIFEVKAQASETKAKNKLQDAINDSDKDIKRIGESLNAIRQRLLDKNDYEGAKKIQRFQNSTDNPYRQKFGAVAVYSASAFSIDLVKEVTTKNHSDPSLKLLIIYSNKLMETIHDMYRRASKC